jgi:hypothetical protein
MSSGEFNCPHQVCPIPLEVYMATPALNFQLIYPKFYAHLESHRHISLSTPQLAPSNSYYEVHLYYVAAQSISTSAVVFSGRRVLALSARLQYASVIGD